MNETIALVVGLALAFVAVVLAGRHIIAENRELKAENDAYKKTNANLLSGLMSQKQCNDWLKSELGATEDAAEQEAER